MSTTLKTKIQEWSQPKDSADKKIHLSFSDDTKYIIAAIIFGAAIGNIFLARKMKTIKFKFFSNSNKYDVNKQSKNKNQEYNESFDTQKKSNRYKQGESIKNQSYQNEFLLLISDELKHLNLPLNKIPSSDEVKSAYRKMALHHHPDRISKDIKNYNMVKSQGIFHNATISKEKLLGYPIIKDKIT